MNFHQISATSVNDTKGSAVTMDTVEMVFTDYVINEKISDEC